MPRSWLALVVVAVAACNSSGGTDASPDVDDMTRDVAAFSDRAYVGHCPGSKLPGAPTPVVLVLHGGAGNAAGMNAITCPGGDVRSVQRRRGPVPLHGQRRARRP